MENKSHTIQITAAMVDLSWHGWPTPAQLCLDSIRVLYGYIEIYVQHEIEVLHENFQP